jgi:hypothetical protein
LFEPTLHIVEHLCAGAIGNEIVEKLWEVPTKTSEPGSMRADLLRFLHDQRLFERIIHLASRYDTTIRAKLEQLLELRNVASARPDLVAVAHSVAEKVADATKSAPFRSFIRSLPSAVQAVESSLKVDIEQGLVLRSESARSADMVIPITIDPRGLVPAKLEAALFEDDDEPLEHMLVLHGRQEADLLWLLLWEIANASSLVAEQAQEYFVLNPLLEIDNNSEAWRRRLRLLVELKILEMPIPRSSAYSFKVPICAEALRAPRNRQENSIRRQRSGR